MKGIQVSNFGEPDVLVYQELPGLTISDEEVLVGLYAAGVNPVETYIRSGNYALKPHLPYTPGSDGAGIILAVGNNVRNFTVGQRVFIASSGGKSSGTYAEQVVCDQGSVFPLPEEVSFIEGAALGTTGLTASRALFQKAKLLPGDIVLIHGGTGGVGTLAVQLAKLHGAIVIATAGSQAGEELLKDLGADLVLNHRNENYLAEIDQITDSHGVDVVIEMLADVNLQKDLEIIALHGRIVIVGNRGEIKINPRLAINRDVEIIGLLSANMTPTEKRENLYRLNAALAHGISPVIQEVIPLAEAQVAHEKIIEQTSTLGKIILTTSYHEEATK